MTGKPTDDERGKEIQELAQVEYKWKKAEEALQQSEDRYRAVMEDMPVLICSFLPSGEITFVNKAYCEFFGSTYGELVGTKFLSLIPKSDQKTVMENICALTVASPAQSHEHKVIAPSGDIRWQRWTNRALFNDQGKTIGYQSIGMDVTERKQAEEALRQERNRAQKLLDIAGVMFIAIDAKGEVTLVNQKGGEVLGYEQKEITGKNWFDSFLPERIKEETKTVFNRLMGGEIEPTEYFENPVLTNTGDERIIAWHNTILKDDQGRIRGTLSSGEDITERKQAEEALRNSQARFRSIVDNAVMGIYQVTHEGKFLLVNHRFAQMFGFKSPEEFLSTVKNINDLYVHPEKRPSILEKIQNRGFVEGAEVQFWNREGKMFLTRVSVRAIQDTKRGKIYEGIMTDITEQKRAEEALRASEEKLARSKKMESLGLLAGGVAHDLNNVLSGLVGYPELLLLDLPPDSKLREPLEAIQDSGHRAIAIVQDLLTVARGVAITKEPLNLNELVSDYLHSPECKMLGQVHPSVTVKTDLDTDLLNISGSHVHIRKVVMNLVSNAAEAAAGGGLVTISTRNRYIDRPLGGYDDVNIGEYVVLAVSDDGTGISPDDLERIFEPFYTKKFMGRSGTGLGLAVVWNTVQDHNGYIDLTSDENGTTFELYFPVTRDELSGKSLSIPIENFKGSGETVLVVDDVESQREISCKMLDALGYKPKAVGSGEEAVAYVKEHTVDLLLLDMIMDPGINGRETYERIIEIHPNQKAVIISGFAETDEVREAQRLGAGKYVKKPVSLEKIGLAVKEELTK